MMRLMELWQLILYGVVGFVMSVLSGITGGGGGFVMTPLLVFLGLSPAQAVSTTKINGLTVSLGALGGLRSQHSSIHWGRVGAIMGLAFGTGLLAPFVIRGLDSDYYRIALGIILLLMVPVMLVKKIGIKPHTPSRLQRVFGYGAVTFALALQGAFSGGLGTLVNVALMGLLGMTVTEAQLAKRWSQIVLNVTVILGVLGSNLIYWPVIPLSIAITLIGGYVGAHLAVKRGNQFAINVMIGLMIASAIALIAGIGF